MLGLSLCHPNNDPGTHRFPSTLPAYGDWDSVHVTRTMTLAPWLPFTLPAYGDSHG